MNFFLCLFALMIKDLMDGTVNSRIVNLFIDIVLLDQDLFQIWKHVAV